MKLACKPGTTLNYQRKFINSVKQSSLKLKRKKKGAANTCKKLSSKRSKALLKTLLLWKNKTFYFKKGLKTVYNWLWLL